MVKLEEFFDELGIRTCLMIEEDSEDYLELVQTAKEMELTEENRRDLLQSFSLRFDGFYLYDWKRYIEIDKDLTEKVEKQVQEIIYSSILKIEDNFDTFYFDVDIDYLTHINNGDIFDVRQEGLEILFPSWAMIRLFIKENEKDDEIQKLMINMMKKISDEQSFYQKIIERLPDIIKEHGN